MNVLFVDPMCHLKTKSADFFLDMLHQEHSVATHYCKRACHCDMPQEKIDAADLIIYWEFLPHRRKIATQFNTHLKGLLNV